MALSDSRVNSSLMGQISRPPSALGSIDTTKRYEINSPINKVNEAYSGAASTLSRMQKKEGSTQTTSGPGPTVSGALTAGLAGVTAGIGLMGAGAGIAAEFATGGTMAALGAVPGIGWALGGLALGAYLFDF